MVMHMYIIHAVYTYILHTIYNSAGIQRHTHAHMATKTARHSHECFCSLKDIRIDAYIHQAYSIYIL